MAPNWQTTRSKLASSNGRSSASACRNETFADDTRVAATSSIGWLRSVATISASGSARASASVTTPVPAAVSRIRRGPNSARPLRHDSAHRAEQQRHHILLVIRRNRAGEAEIHVFHRNGLQSLGVSLDVRRWTMATTMTDSSAEREAMVERQLKRRGITRAAHILDAFRAGAARGVRQCRNMRISPMATTRCRSRRSRPSRSLTSSR